MCFAAQQHCAEPFHAKHECIAKWRFHNPFVGPSEIEFGSTNVGNYLTS